MQRNVQTFQTGIIVLSDIVLDFIEEAIVLLQLFIGTKNFFKNL